MNKGILIGLVILVAAAIGAGGWFAYSSGKIGSTESAATATSATSTSAASTSTASTSTAAPAAAAPAATDGAMPVVGPDEMFLGKADAPVTIIEYFSLGCPHCKRFHEEILPQVKADFIDTGKARIVFRDFPLDGVALSAAQLTRCVSPMAYFAMVDTLFKQQSDWHVQDGVPNIAKIAKGAGMDQATFDACIGNKELREKIANGAKDAQAKFQVQATPTFLINGAKSGGVGEYAEFKALVEAALAGQ